MLDLHLKRAYAALGIIAPTAQSHPPHLIVRRGGFVEEDTHALEEQQLHIPSKALVDIPALHLHSAHQDLHFPKGALLAHTIQSMENLFVPHVLQVLYALEIRRIRGHALYDTFAKKGPAQASCVPTVHMAQR